jgi:hypothetical protein
MMTTHAVPMCVSPDHPIFLAQWRIGSGERVLQVMEDERRAIELPQER